MVGLGVLLPSGLLTLLDGSATSAPLCFVQRFAESGGPVGIVKAAGMEVLRLDEREEGEGWSLLWAAQDDVLPFPSLANGGLQRANVG